VRVGAVSVSESLKRCTRSTRAGAALLLVALASAGGVAVAGDGPVSCQNLATTVRTNESSYAPGKTVIISVTLANEGPACVIPTLSLCGPPPGRASAYNSAGEVVWESAGGHITCPYEPVTSVSYPEGYSSTQQVDWSLGKCALQPRRPILNCPRTLLPAGKYRIVGSYWTSASTTITISR